MFSSDRGDTAATGSTATSTVLIRVPIAAVGSLLGSEEADIFQRAPEQRFPVALNDAPMPDDDSVEISGQECCH
jgi:hypothetical protein